MTAGAAPRTWTLVRRTGSPARSWSSSGSSWCRCPVRGGPSSSRASLRWGPSSPGASGCWRRFSVGWLRPRRCCTAFRVRCAPSRTPPRREEWSPLSACSSVLLAGRVARRGINGPACRPAIRAPDSSPPAASGKRSTGLGPRPSSLRRRAARTPPIGAAPPRRATPPGTARPASGAMQFEQARPAVVVRASGTFAAYTDCGDHQRRVAAAQCLGAASASRRGGGRGQRGCSSANAMGLALSLLLQDVLRYFGWCALASFFVGLCWLACSVTCAGRRTVGANQDPAPEEAAACAEAARGIAEFERWLGAASARPRFRRPRVMLSQGRLPPAVRCPPGVWLAHARK